MSVLVCVNCGQHFDKHEALGACPGYDVNKSAYLEHHPNGWTLDNLDGHYVVNPAGSNWTAYSTGTFGDARHWMQTHRFDGPTRRAVRRPA